MSRSSVRPTHALLAVPLVAAAAWVAHRGSVMRDDPAVVLAALRAALGPSLPAAAAVGASARTDVATYDRDTLYEFIDGAADAYLARGFERCAAADYTFGAGAEPPVEVAAEAHRFASSAGALDQRDADRPVAATAVPGLTDGMTDGNVLLAVHDRDLLKLTALTTTPAAGDALVRLAVAWERELE